MIRFAPASLCLAAALALAPVSALAQQARLTVTGEGSASAVPDMATVSLGVSAQNAEAGVAMDEASRVAAEILSRLDALGIAARDRQTSDIGLQPVWARSDNEDPRITGYEASNQLTVRVRDLATLGDVLASVTEGGANRLAGLSFGLQEPGPVMDAARRDAVADAMARARVLAEAAGVTLGPIVTIAEGGSYEAPSPKMDMARVMSAPVAAGEQSLSASVTVVFALGDVSPE
ncbi:SIMPL domain-containing protein [Citreicella sp. C3M06]|uniref:SIMPL domain-containing protein n=1 Tax=Citreicella sp. C3M06 TaxID=2841564 RepID=UPI001C0A521A|nr:SIMPL domain-containing protein [Citreicella sp. C3M06]MBU2961796.1 SIMPL domain-containing protein [Citreicella sp. C3M06]